MRKLHDGIAWGILSQKEICEILDSNWGKKMLHDGLGEMMRTDMKLTDKQFMKKHGLDGKWYD